MAEINDTNEIEDRLVEAEAQIEALQAAVADAEARAATARSEVSELRTQVTDGQTALEASQAQVREAAARYRSARLSSAPDVPPELVAETGSIEEVERDFESATRLVAALKERMREEAVREQGGRVPRGAPQRREQDLSSLPASEKIKIGLRQLSEREGR
jgi:chromosome condensin MukBEF ATPase and DNA-binding subunit MukB